MEDAQSAVEITEVEGVKVAVPQSPRILDDIYISKIGEELTNAITGSQNPKLIIDFEKVTNMSSSALGMLITVHKRVREAGGELRLCNINPNIEEVFRITRLDEIFIMDIDRQGSLTNIKSH